MKLRLCLVIGLFASPALGFKANTKANAAYYSANEGDGTTGFRMNQLDLSFTLNDRSSKAFFKFNFIDIYSGLVIDTSTTGTGTTTADESNTLASTSIEDAWVEYTYNSYLTVKAGFEDAHWVFDGRNTAIWSGVRLNREEAFQKLEMRGRVTNSISYSLMVWQDPNSGSDSSLGDNLSAMAEYKHSYKFKLGGIYRKKMVSGAEHTGNAMFASYSAGSIFLSAKQLNLVKGPDNIGGMATSAGITYRVDGNVSFKGYYSSLTKVDEEVATKTMDFALWYKLQSQAYLYGQYVSIQEDVAGTEAVNRTVIGIETSF